MKTDLENSFRRHLELIRRRPEVMIGKKSIRMLDMYLLGFIQCAEMNSIKHPFVDFPEFKEFDYFIKEKLDSVTSTLNGAYLLYCHYQEDEEKAFNAYFELLDEFVEIKKK
jgi:hypothetical protein